MADNEQLKSEEASPLSKGLREALEERYIMVTKNKFLAFLGGAAAFLVVVGFVSWEVTLSALKTGQGKLSLAAIQKEAEEAERTAKRLREIKAAAESDASHAVNTIDARIARTNHLNALKQQKSSLESQIVALNAVKGFGEGGARQRIPSVQAQLKSVEAEVAKIESEK